LVRHDNSHPGFGVYPDSKNVVPYKYFSNGAMRQFKGDLLPIVTGGVRYDSRVGRFYAPLFSKEARFLMAHSP
jgi:hypothetical protein